MTVFGLASVMTFGVYIAVLKRAQHTERTLKGTAELRYAADTISQAMRSASQRATVSADGLKLYVPPKDLGYVIVQEVTWIDMVAGVKGSKANQRMLQLSNVTAPAVVASVWRDATRPAGALASSDVATYFVDASSLPTRDLSELFSVGDTITIPATAYGPKTTGVINSMSNNAGTKTITLEANLGVDVPNGTKIVATSGRRLVFEVVATGSHAGELRYYPDSRNLSAYTVLSHDISAAPLVNPANTAGGTTTPFALSASAQGYVTINLQKIPAGSSTGRTLQGLQSTVYTRTDPLIP